MNNDGLAQDGCGARSQGDPVGMNVYSGGLAGIGFEIAEVSGVLLSGTGSAMGRSSGIKVTAGAGAIRRAAIAVFVNVKTVSSGHKARNSSCEVDSIAHRHQTDRSPDAVSLSRLQYGGGVLRSQPCSRDQYHTA